VSTWLPSPRIRDDIALRIQQLSRVQMPINNSDIAEAVACALAAVTQADLCGDCQANDHERRVTCCAAPLPW
jgi:hypothetical protein